jgi:hypothetical protein
VQRREWQITKVGNLILRACCVSRSFSMILCLFFVPALSACRTPVLRASKTLRGFEICSAFSEGLAVVRDSKSRKFGYIGTDGEIVIPPRFADAQPFDEGLAAVQVAQWGKYGYIDKSGQSAIDPAFDGAFPFSEGLASIRIRGRYGFIDKVGRLKIEALFERASAFSGGRAKIVQQGLAGFIDSEGRTVIGAAYFKAGRFRDGLAPACTQTRCGFLDADGGTAIPFQYEDAGEFSAGFAPVRSGGKWGYLDTKGKWLVEPEFDEAHEFQDDAALVGRIMGSQPDRGYGGYSGTAMVYGYLARSGKYLIELSLHHASPFSEGLARIQIPTGGLCSDCYETSYLRKDGSLLPRYQFGGDFHGGAAVVKDGLSGQAGFLIDREGNALIEFDEPRFEDPLRAAAAPTSVRYGYIDPVGDVSIPHEFTAAEPFSEGLALVGGRDREKGRRSGFTDRTGARKLNVPANASRVESFAGGFALLWFYQQGGHRFAYMNHAGVIQIEAPFKEVASFSEGLAAVRVSDRADRNDWGYINQKGELAIQPGFTAAGSFVQGLATVAFIKGTYIYSGLIDRTGRILVELPYRPESANDRDGRRKRSLPSISRELIPAQDNKGFGYVNRAGSWVIRDSRFLAGDAFSQGLAPVLMPQRDGITRWGYIDTRGAVVIGARFREAQPFSEGLALVRDDAGLYGFIHPDGTWAMPPSFFEEAFSLSEGRALVKLNGSYGYVDRKGAIVVSPKYVRAAPFSEGLAVTGIER